MSNHYRPSGFGGFSFFPPVIKNLLIINVAIFFVQVLAQNIVVGDKIASEIIIRWFALMPIGSGLFQIWQLITFQFLHGSFGHILFNMFALWMFGMEIENLWGSKKFLYFYLLAGVVAGLCHLFISPLLGALPAPTIGASGGVYGVLVAFALLFPNRYIFLYFFIPIKAKYLITFLIVMEIMLIDSAHSTVAHLAHLGGALAGLIFILLDKSIDAEIKHLFGRKTYRPKQPFPKDRSDNPFGGISNPFKRNEKIEEAKYYDINEKEDKITQEQLDKILDKISQSGYQNLTDEEKRILFEASKKMK